MRQKERIGRRRRRAAALLALIFFTAGAGWVMGRESGMGRSLMQAFKDKVFFDAVCAVSPLVGYLLEESESGAAGELHSGESYSEEALQSEMEALLLAEQQAESLPVSAVQPQEGVSGQENDAEQKNEEAAQSDQTQSTQNLFPEDADEILGTLTEPDADLLAEIERENEALRELAEASKGQAEAAGGELTLPYTMEQLADLNFLRENIYNVNQSTAVDTQLLNAEAMLGQDMSLQNPDSGGPKVLIHHTHATEYFADSDESDPSTLIVGVGDYLEEILETKYGIETIHDTTVYPYNEAYSQALENVEQILAENPTIEVFIDLHRDSAGSKKYTVEIGGKETANIMFFNGISRNLNGPIDYLTNDNLAQNLAFSFQLKMAGDSMYPGLCKRNYIKSYRYNLHVLPRSVIVEVGDNNNTLQEAKNAMEPLAAILNYVLNGG